MATIIGSRGGVILAVTALAVAMGVAPAWPGADEGKALYEKQCKSCHSLAGVAGKMASTGGPLDGVGAKRDADWLRAYFKDPKSKIPNAKMPKMSLSEPQWEDAVQYMLTLKEPPPAKKP